MLGYKLLDDAIGGWKKNKPAGFESVTCREGATGAVGSLSASQHKKPLYLSR